MINRRKIDELVAENVMGWQLVDYHGNAATTLEEYQDAAQNDGWTFNGTDEAHSWRPSSNIAQAWEVLEAVDLDWKIEPHRVEFEEPVEQDDGPMYYESKKHRADVGDDGTFAEATALAICLAALKTKGVRVDNLEEQP